MKKIGLVLPEAPQYSETFFNYKIRGLQESGFEVIVFSGKKVSHELFFKNVGAYPVFQKSPFEQGILFVSVLLSVFIRHPSRSFKLFSLERNDGSSFMNSLKTVYLNAHILPYKLDQLHFGFSTMALGRENVSRAIGAVMSVSFRGYDINVYPLKHTGCYNKLWKRVNKIHSISKYLHTKAIQMGLSPNTQFEIITPAIDLPKFTFKKDNGKIRKPLTILTVGRLNWIKDYETSISAMKELKNCGIDFVYNIIGDGPELERLKFAVYDSGLIDQVKFLGRLGHDEINSRMDEADIYLQTSLEEGFCVSVLEAQAKGLLCVVSDANGLKENVMDGVTGWVVPKRNPAAFAKKIIDIINLPEENRSEVSLNARRRVEAEFDIKDQKEKFKKFFLN